MAQPEVEARNALKALFTASRPRTTADGSDGTSGERVAAREQAGIALREVFKSDIRKALPSPVAPETWKEVERQVFKSLEQVKPHSSGFQPPPRRAKSSSAVSIEVQTVAMPAPPREVQEPPVEAPKPSYELPKMRRCVELEHERVVGPLRTKVLEAQRRLFSLDSETTRLTRALKKSRMEIWEHQRSSSHMEREIDRILESRASGIPESMRAEFAKIVEEESRLYAELKVERDKNQTARSHVRQQERMLQQEREASKGEVHRILQRHPCGDVFLPPMSMGDSDDDSSDDYREPTRRPPQRTSDRVQLGSSDEDEEEYSNRRPPTGSTGGEGPPPPPSQGFRATSFQDGDDESEASSVTSPSSGGGGPSPSNARLASTVPASKPREARGAPSDSSDYVNSNSSDDGKAEKDAPPKAENDSATPLETEGSKRTSPSQGQQRAVPPLPELSGLSRESTKAAANVDEAEEVSSEEDFEDESSQSV